MSRRKAEKNDLIKAVKDINKRMEDFQDSVQSLISLKDGLDELDESLAERERVNKYKLEALDKSFQDNKLKAVKQAAEDVGKVIISNEELEELKKSLSTIKTDAETKLADYKSSSDKLFNEKLTQQLEMQKLQNECITANLRAEVESHKKEVENLKESLNRMSEELKSQKQLTAEVAGMGRQSKNNQS